MLKRTFILRNELKNKIKEVIPKKLAELKEVKTKYGDKKMGDFTVSQVLGGMRGMNALFYDGSKLDAYKGIMLRGRNLFDLCEKLKYKNSHEPLPESLIWYLFTGELPSEKQTEFVIKDIQRRNKEVDFTETENMLHYLSPDLHPMTQLSMAVLCLQKNSIFAKAYRDGSINKSNYWETYFEDCMNLISLLPRIAAIIYNNCFHNKRPTPKMNDNYNMSENYTKMLGFDNEELINYISHYLVLHSDHEGGNVSAHASILVSSALSDPFFSYSAGLNGLAGPLHGLANQEVLRWLIDCHQTLGKNPSDKALEDYTKSILNSGKVIPGYGHAVLREIDPRYVIQVQLGDKYLPNNDLFRLVKQCLKVIPNVLKATGKVKNPWPNVDCSSGVLLYHYGIKEFDYYTVMFGVSRAFGVLPMLMWSRALGLAIERPGSVNLDWIKTNIKL